MPQRAHFKTSFTDEQAATSAVFSQYLNDLIARIEAQPGVESAAAALNLPTQIVPDWPFDIIGGRPGEQGSSGDEKCIRSPQTILLRFVFDNRGARFRCGKISTAYRRS